MKPQVVGVKIPKDIWNHQLEKISAWFTAVFIVTGADAVVCTMISRTWSLVQRWDPQISIEVIFWLVVEPTYLKNMSENGFVFPKGENQEYLKFHHLVFYS